MKPVLKITKSHEIDIKLLAFLTDLYEQLQKHSGMHVYDLVLSDYRKKHDLHKIPSQNVLHQYVDWSKKPDLETAIMVHSLMNQEKRGILEEPQPEMPNDPEPTPLTQSERDKFSIKINILEGSLKQSENERKRLVAEINHYKETIGSAGVGKNEELEKQLEETQDELSETMIERNELKKRVETLEHDYAERGKDLDAMFEFNRALRQEIARFCDRVMKLSNAYEGKAEQSEADNK